MMFLRAAITILATLSQIYGNNGFQQGQDYAHSMNVAMPNVDSFPMPVTTNIPEASYNEDDLLNKGESNELFREIRDNSSTRPRFKIDDNDPLITGASEIMADPHKTITGRSDDSVWQEETTYEIKTCQEPGQPYESKCRRKIQPYIVKTAFEKSSTVEVRNHEAEAHMVSLQDMAIKKLDIPLHTLKSISKQEDIVVYRRRWCGRERKVLGAIFNVIWMEEKKSVDFSVVDGCQELDRLLDEGKGMILRRQCLASGTRIIEGVPATRDCWEEEITYLLQQPVSSPNHCDVLRAQGCEQINSKCIKTNDQDCILFENTFRCANGRKRVKISGSSGGDIQCLDGNCGGANFVPNNEMADAISKLQVFSEMQGNSNDPSNFKIFPGVSHSCTRSLTNFKDCCGMPSGWGKDLGLADCSSEEEALLRKRKDGLCHLVGTFVAEQFLGQWTRKKTSFCCFISKLMRIIHEQGRPQIGLGWGSPQEPQCRGFTVEEMARISLDRIDMSEFTEDVIKHYKTPDANALRSSIEAKVKKMTANFNSNRGQ